MAPKLKAHRKRFCTPHILSAISLLSVLLLLTGTAGAQSGLITFEESKWNPVVGVRLYHGGPANTLTDPDYGVSFIIAYGEMNVTSMGPGLRSLFFSPIITSNGTTDGSGMVVIRFTTAKERVQLKLSHDEHPVHTPDYMKVAYYSDLASTDLLYFESIPWNSGAYSHVMYANASSGIRSVVVTSMYAENNLDNLEFVQLGTPFAFNDGTVQGWTLQGAFDEAGGGPFSSGFFSLWKDEIDHPAPPGQACAGDNCGSFCLGCMSGHGISNPGKTWWIMQMHSPDLSGNSDWQTATGFTVQIANCMGPSTVYANLYVKVYDLDQAKNRWFYSGTAQPLLHDVYGDATAVWNFLTFDWSEISSFPPNRTVCEVFVNIWGTLAGTYEGSVSLDLVTPIYDAPVPVQLASFEARLAVGTGITLQWTTLSEIGNYGFEVQRKGIGDPDFQALDGAFIPGHGTTAVPHTYTYTDETAGPGAWWYRLKQIDLDGSAWYSPTIAVVVPATSSPADPIVDRSPALHQNYPNPFNPVTTIRYSIGSGASERRVRLAVFDLLGREVAVLVDGALAPGSYAATFNATGHAAGIYVYRLTAGAFVESRTMLLLR